ncbi:hypothetical protein KCP77_12740 [Salmonella enterica subsp. enterica]|nr:hypothetical protein KCP77_12740 [Salmonella enterica subsp. enterica]
MIPARPRISKNVLSRKQLEGFDGGSIAHAAGTGGFGCGWHCTLPSSTRPATSSKAAL